MDQSPIYLKLQPSLILPLHTIHHGCSDDCTMDLLSLLRSLHITYIWPVLAGVAVLYVLWMAYGLARRADWTSGPAMASLLFLILLDVQLLLGATLWILQQRWTGDDVMRSWEHPFHMIVALTLYHVGYRQLKRATAAKAKFRAALIWSTACLVLLGMGIIRMVV